MKKMIIMYKMDVTFPYLTDTERGSFVRLVGTSRNRAAASQRIPSRKVFSFARFMEYILYSSLKPVIQNLS